MNGKNECSFNDNIINISKENLHRNSFTENEITVCSTQTNVQKSIYDIEVQGTANESIKPITNTNDQQIFKELKMHINKTGKDLSFLNMPSVEEIPLSEYNEDILPNVFPHLYPGGIGGNNNHFQDNCDLHNYAKRLLNYEDGRFASDKVWCYYTLDMIQRHKNNRNGNFIIKDGYLGNVCETVEKLKEKVSKGDLSWIDMLRNFSKNIRGSDNYWRSKRYELESWINYHVENGNGAPTMFITLSCAENWWKDLQILLKERLKNIKNHEFLIKEMDSPDEKNRMSSRSKVTTLYSVLVQEFFQIRTKYWLETVGKDVFDIAHYWGRFEFAKGRGQIHLHMLAITKNRHHQYEYWKHIQENEMEKAVSVMANYARQHLGLIANHPAVKECEEVEGHKNVSSIIIDILYIFQQTE